MVVKPRNFHAAVWKLWLGFFMCEVLLKLRKIPLKSHIKISEQVPIAGFKEVMCSRWHGLRCKDGSSRH